MGDEIQPKVILDWMRSLIKAQDKKALATLVSKNPEVKHLADGVKSASSFQPQNGESLFFHKRNLVASILSVFDGRHNQLKSKTTYEVFEREQSLLYQVCCQKDSLFRLDLPGFIEGMSLAKTETEIACVLDLAPKRFQGEIWELWGNLPSLADNPDDFRAKTVAKTKEIIWHVASQTGNRGGCSLQPSTFNAWLDEIPLLAYDLTHPLKETYWHQGYVYDNFDDVMSWDERDFYEHALGKIKDWLVGF